MRNVPKADPLTPVLALDKPKLIANSPIGLKTPDRYFKAKFPLRTSGLKTK